MPFTRPESLVLEERDSARKVMRVLSSGCGLGGGGEGGGRGGRGGREGEKGGRRPNERDWFPSHQQHLTCPLPQPPHPPPLPSSPHFIPSPPPPPSPPSHRFVQSEEAQEYTQPIHGEGVHHSLKISLELPHARR